MTFPTHKNSNDISIEAVYLIRLFICHYVQKKFYRCHSTPDSNIENESIGRAPEF